MSTEAHNRHRGKFAHKVPDYEVAETTKYQNATRALTPADLQDKHPYEWAAIDSGLRKEHVGALAENEVLLTNLPSQASDFRTPASVAAFLHKHVHADLQINKVTIVDGMLMPGEDKERLAYVTVSTGSKRQANLIHKHLFKHWYGDTLLKCKLQEDAQKE